MMIRIACIYTFLIVGSCTITFDSLFPITKAEDDKPYINIERNPHEKGAASG
jgi:hypothetical protein|tara:strand:+ start:7178 stop:7333 length:156 start_codon:yes stop_codon:yes gene_type:complete